MYRVWYLFGLQNQSLFHEYLIYISFYLNEGSKDYYFSFFKKDFFNFIIFSYLFYSCLLILLNNFIYKNIYIYIFVVELSIGIIIRFPFIKIIRFKNQFLLFSRDNRSVIILSKYQMIKITLNSESFNKRLIRPTLNYISFIDVTVCLAI